MIDPRGFYSHIIYPGTKDKNFYFQWAVTCWTISNVYLHGENLFIKIYSISSINREQYCI